MFPSQRSRLLGWPSLRRIEAHLSRQHNRGRRRQFDLDFCSTRRYSSRRNSHCWTGHDFDLNHFNSPLSRRNRNVFEQRKVDFYRTSHHDDSIKVSRSHAQLVHSCSMRGDLRNALTPDPNADLGAPIYSRLNHSRSCRRDRNATCCTIIDYIGSRSFGRDY